MTVKSLALIDGPNPLASLEEWEAFAARMAVLAPTNESAASELADAKRMIASLKREASENERELHGAD